MKDSNLIKEIENLVDQGSWQVIKEKISALELESLKEYEPEEKIILFFAFATAMNRLKEYNEAMDFFNRLKGHLRQDNDGEVVAVVIALSADTMNSMRQDKLARMVLNSCSVVAEQKKYVSAIAASAIVYKRMDTIPLRLDDKLNQVPERIRKLIELWQH